ncbi:GH92 family glycosyl hydrolase [Bacteroidota bacterium]
MKLFMHHFKRCALLTFLISLPLTWSCQGPPEKIRESSVVDLVNTQIGAISHLLVPTFPTVQIPNSMVRIHPYTTPGINDNYLASRIFGFPINIPSHRNAPFSTIMISANKNAFDPVSFASSYDHDFETSSPYHYTVLLEDPDVWAEYTVTEHGAIYTFKSNSKKSLRLAFRCTGSGMYSLDENSIVTGQDHRRGVTQYLYAAVDPVPDHFQAFSGEENKIIQTPDEGPESGIVLNFDLPENGIITVRTGISYISVDQARKNYEKEVKDKEFSMLAAEARGKWEYILGKIKVQGGSSDQQIAFYTFLYRCFERMVNITEDGSYFSVFDGEIHDAGDHDFYVDDWSWDTFRTLHPLRSILVPDREIDMINSYVRIYEQSGWMPAFPTIFGEMGAMIGHHQAAIITDAWNKGLRDFDIEKAYEGLYKNAMEGTRIPWREGPKSALDEIYLEKGFFPARKPGEPETEERVHDFERRQAVAVTLEHTYDDWCLSRLAEELGKDEDAEYFHIRGQNYRNLYHPETGFMTPKSADGAWIEPYDPISPAGVGGRAYFAESNAFTYTWFVPHDIEGLINLMGGKDVAISRLDDLFDHPIGRSKWSYLGYMPDATGLTGLYPMGNEPSFHVPYLYNYLGEPWKTQKRLRQLMQSWFRNDLMGVCGDEDGGALSAWFVFSAMGFYPACPGEPVYTIGSPLFESIEISLGNGKTFTIKANNASNQNKYISSAQLNGKTLDKLFFTHQELMAGGELILEMVDRPVKEW